MAPPPRNPNVDATYAWRLLAEEVGPAVGPIAPSCSVSFSPLSLHVAASILAVGSSIAPAEPSAERDDRRACLLSFLASNGFGRLPSKAASSAVSAATGRKADDDKDAPVIFFTNALWVRRYLVIGHTKLMWETGRYRSLIHVGDFKSEVRFHLHSVPFV